LNVQPPTVVSLENDSAVMLEAPKKAVPVGTVPEAQLAAVLKSPVPGLASQVASCARAGSAAGSVDARADDASKAARNPRPAPNRSFTMRNATTSPFARPCAASSRSAMRNRPRQPKKSSLHQLHRIGARGCPDKAMETF